MTAKEQAAYARARKELERAGVLLVSDSRLTSLVGLVAEAPQRGSWWAHPQAHAIFRVAQRLSRHPDVLTVRLIGGKETMVHRKLWPALLAAGKAREAWQLEDLSAQAHSLLKSLARAGMLRTDRVARLTGESASALGEAARELERKLLLYAESVHTESGTHYKQLESWRHLRSRRKIKLRKLSAETARKLLEERATSLAARFGVPVKLPWKKIDPSRPVRPHR